MWSFWNPTNEQLVISKMSSNAKLHGAILLENIVLQQFLVYSFNYFIATAAAANLHKFKFTTLFKQNLNVQT